MNMNTKKILLLGLVAAVYLGTSAFCGFYVAKADATLFNDRSEVILVRDGKHTIVTMSNDFQGNVKDFAMVVPVPSILERGDIKVVNPDVFRKLDSYSSPRLVEYHDQNPCMVWTETVEDVELEAKVFMDMVPTMNLSSRSRKDLGVTVEARYSVEEYEVLILSAKESSGLQTWLDMNGYKVPGQAKEVLEPYIKSNMKFFVVKVDLNKHDLMGNNMLRPLQIRFESEKFMLPIRLGMANSKGEQDMVVYSFTKTGRVECVNYRTVEVPTDRKIPLFVREKFGDFYKNVYDKNYERQGKNAIHLEYAWNVTPSWGGMKCDPCVGPPPMQQEFVDAGVDWTNSGGQQVFFTRMHVRYSRERFPQDLFFQVTPNTTHYQARYVLTNPAQGDLSCQNGQDYLIELYQRRNIELDEMAALTGWDRNKYSDYLAQVKGRMHPDTIRKMDALVPVFNPSGGGGAGPWIVTLVLLFVIGLMIRTAMRQYGLRAKRVTSAG
jgi:hypothetical protein